MERFRVLICGGGVAALEGVLRLRSVAGDAVAVTLLAPGERFTYRPHTVLDAMGFGAARSYPLEAVVADAGADLVADGLVSLDVHGRRARTRAGRDLHFDAALVAVGGRQEAGLEHVITFRDAEAQELHDRVVGDVVAGRARSVAFVLPEGPVHPLPLYELALMTAVRARDAAVSRPEIHLVTPEPAPLAVFGAGASAAVGGVLRQAGIRVHLSAMSYVPAPGRLLIQPQGADLAPDRIVAMPRVLGAQVDGLPGGGVNGFIPIDGNCAVPGTGGRVFAAGDAAAFPVKHGGLAAQQADTAATAIAHLAGAAGDPPPFQAEIRAKLLTGGRPLYLSARVAGGQGFESEVTESPPWASDEKIVALELGPYLAGRD